MAIVLTLALLTGLCPWVSAAEVEETVPSEEQESQISENKGKETDSPTLLNAGAIAYPVTGGNIYFNTSTGTVTGCDRTVTTATIPMSIAGTTVTIITIPSRVSSIGLSAFGTCCHLTAINVDRKNPYTHSAFFGTGSLPRKLSGGTDCSL